MVKYGIFPAPGIYTPTVPQAKEIAHFMGDIATPVHEIATLIKF